MPLFEWGLRIAGPLRPDPLLVVTQGSFHFRSAPRGRGPIMSKIDSRLSLLCVDVDIEAEVPDNHLGSQMIQWRVRERALILPRFLGHQSLLFCVPPKSSLSIIIIIFFIPTMYPLRFESDPLDTISSTRLHQGAPRYRPRTMGSLGAWLNVCSSHHSIFFDSPNTFWRASTIISNGSL